MDLGSALGFLRVFCSALILSLALVLSAVFAAPIASGEDGEVSVGDRGKKIAELVERIHANGEFSGAVLAARDGKVVCALAVGEIGDGSGDSLQTTTLFEIASSTKPFTAIAIMVLVEQGKLVLDESISKYLPGIPEDCEAITVRHLMQHTSGIPGTNTQGGGSDIERALPSFLKGGPQHTPGTRWEYWNIGYALLSEIIARTSGQSYVDFCREAIFEKAGVSSTGFVGDQSIGPVGTTVATGTSLLKPDRSALKPPYHPTLYTLNYRGMGGMVTSVWDLWRLDRALKSGKILNDGSMQKMTAAGNFDYALGWKVGSDPDGKPYHQHGGGVAGFRASVNRYPSIDGCIVVLGNDESGTGVLAAACEKLLFGQDVKLPPLNTSGVSQKPQPLTASLLASIVGEYVDAKGQVLTIRAQKSFGKAVIVWAGGKPSGGVIGQDAAGNLLWYSAARGIPTDFDIQSGKAVSCKFLSSKFIAQATGPANVPSPMKATVAAKTTPLPDGLLKAIIGSYTDDKGRTLSVTAENSSARAEVDWKNGRKSSGALAQDEDGRVVWSFGPKSYPLEFEIESGKAMRCRFNTSVFEADSE